MSQPLCCILNPVYYCEEHEVADVRYCMDHIHMIYDDVLTLSGKRRFKSFVCGECYAKKNLPSVTEKKV